jgi:hypothetical protein
MRSPNDGPTIRYNWCPQRETDHGQNPAVDPATLGPNVTDNIRATPETLNLHRPRRNAIFPGSPLSPPGSGNANSAVTTEATVTDPRPDNSASSSAIQVTATDTASTSPSGHNA